MMAYAKISFMTKINILERDILKVIKDWLDLKGYFYWRNHTGPVFINNGQMRKNPLKGIPDLQGIFPNGHSFFIECKRPKGKLSEEQKKWEENLKRNNVVYVEAFSVEDVTEKFKCYGF